MRREHHAMMMRDYKRRFIISTLLTIPIILLSPFIQENLNISLRFTGDQYVLFILSAIVFAYGGYPFLKGMGKEVRTRDPGMMTLIGLAISIAFIYSAAVTFLIPGKTFYWELATLVDIMLLGHYVEMRSIKESYSALEEIVKLMPKKAHLIRDDEVVDVDVSQLMVGDIVLVRPGEKIPSDGLIIEGETSIDESMLTGESQPVYRKVGDKAIGGSINLEGSIKVKIERTGEDTYLMQVVKLITEIQEAKSRTQSLADRAAYYLTIIAITAGVITLGIWFYINRDMLFALERMVTVMVITCPHALGLAIPLVIAVSTAISAKKGLLIKNRESFETARDIDVIVFDKTGTLTDGKFIVTDIISLTDLSEAEILRYAASLENNSEHPIARGIVEKAEELGLELYSVSEFKAMPGKGVLGVVDGSRVAVVNPMYIEEANIEFDVHKVAHLLKEGKTLIYVLKDNKVLGAIALFDNVRPESLEAVNSLKEMGIKIYMLTGDNERVAKKVSDELGLDGYYANVLPHEKSKVIKKLQDKGFTVAMVGDGVNDAPALLQADVGIAIGAGTDLAIESSGMILVRNDPRDVVTAIKLARKTYRKMVENLIWATGYNAFAIPLAAGVLYNLGILLTPAAGAVLMSISTVIVAVNARSLKI